MDIRFLSGNKFKIAEIKEILEPAGVQVVPVDKEINEIQTEDVTALVRDKALKAFSVVGRPVFVEHTGLFLPGLNNLPGGLTRIFWDRLQADAFAKLVSALSTREVVAKTTIGYCDSQTIHYFEGEVRGTVPTEPSGPRQFQWDCVFVPDGSSETFADMGARKNEVSMRRRALDQLANFLRTQ